MATQVFHFSNTGVSSGQAFCLKEAQSRILLRNLVLDSNSLISGSNLVYNNGNQTISGVKTFATGIVAPNIVYNTGNQTISGVKTFATGIVAPNIVYNTGDQTISGIKTFASRPTVSGTGVLLSGSTPFVLTYGHTRDNTTAGDVRRYFGPHMDIGPASLNSNENRRTRIMKDCFLREVSWAVIARDNIPTPSNAITGYFKNFGNNPSTDDQTSGVQVTSAINVPTINEIHNYSTGNLNIPITGGNYVSFYYQTNLTAGSNNAASGLAVNVDAYFYV